jgi:hypothetical protein
MRVGIYGPTGSQIGVAKLADDGRVILGMHPGHERFLRHFACVAADRSVVEIEDGEPWLRALPRNLHGTLTRAVEIKSRRRDDSG